MGRAPDAVSAMRLKLGKPYANPARKPWMENELVLLGKMPDQEVARRTGRTVGTVRQARISRGITYELSNRRPWTAEEDRWLGTASDAEIALRLGRSLYRIKIRRQSLKIPAWRSRQ